MEIAEVRIDGIKQQNVSFAPLIKSLLTDTFLKHTEQHLAHEHRHGILVKVASDAGKWTSGGKISGSIKVGLRRLLNVSLKYVQRQEQRHILLAGSTYKKASPSIIPAQGMDDERVLSELGCM